MTPQPRPTALRAVDPRYPDRPLPKFDQLCQIVKGEFNASEDHSEWRERSKRRSLKLGFYYNGREIEKAMEANERAHRLTFIARPKPAKMHDPLPAPLNKSEAADLYRQIKARYAASQAGRA